VVFDRHELLVEHPGDQEVAGVARAVGVAEPRVARAELGAAGRTRPSIDDARQVAEVVRDRGRERQRRRGGRLALQCRSEDTLLAGELGVDRLGQRSRFCVETEHERSSQRTGSHRQPFAVVAR
jgi:hypothetical protein